MGHTLGMLDGPAGWAYPSRTYPIAIFFDAALCLNCTRMVPVVKAALYELTMSADSVG